MDCGKSKDITVCVSSPKLNPQIDDFKPARIKIKNLNN